MQFKYTTSIFLNILLLEEHISQMFFHLLACTAAVCHVSFSLLLSPRGCNFPFIAFLSSLMSRGFIRFNLYLRYAKKTHTEKSGERAGHGMITTAWCAATHCSIATKMVSVKPVTDDSTSHLADSCTNLLRFKTRPVPANHPV